MIYDLLTNYNLYSKANARLALGFEWLSKLNPKTLDGRIDIKGDEVFAIVQSYTTFPANEKRFETHKDHIDIQYIFEGEEMMYYEPVRNLTVTEAYNPERDVAFYADSAEFVSLPCKTGQFTVFYPEDAHKPSCILNKASYVRKVVVKVKF